MTVSSTNIISGPYTGNGVTVNFSYTFKVQAKTDLIVYETDDTGVVTTLVVDTDYTVNNVGSPSGTITRAAGALPSGYTWYIRANYEATQETDFNSQGAFFPDVHEDAFDKLDYLILQYLDRVSRSVRISDNDPDLLGTINALAAERAGKTIQFDASGNPVVVNPVDIYGAIPANSAVFNSIATLRLNVSSTLTTAFVLTDGLGVWVFDATDTTTVDNSYAAVVDAQSPRTGTWKKIVKDVVDTIADLKKLQKYNLINGQTFKTKGYTFVDDNGQAIYKWNNASVVADDGFLIHALNSGGTGRFELQHENEFYLEIAGAVHNGNIDSVLTKISAVSGRKIIISSPNKLFYINDDWYFPSYTTLLMYGSQWKVEDGALLTRGNIYLTDPTQLLGKDEVSIRGGVIDANGPNRVGGTRTAATIYAACTRDFDIRDLKIINSPWEGMQLASNKAAGGSSDCRNGWLSNLTIERSYRNNLSITGCTNVNGDSLHLSAARGADPQAGLAIEANALSDPNINCHFTNVYVNGNAGPGIYAANTWNYNCSVNGVRATNNGNSPINASYVGGVADLQSGFTSATGGRLKIYNVTGNNNGGGLFGVAGSFDEAKTFQASAVFDGTGANGTKTPSFGANIYTITKTATGTFSVVLREDANLSLSITGSVNGSGFVTYGNTPNNRQVDFFTKNNAGSNTDFSRTFITIHAIINT